MATGDINDIHARLRGYLPARWFGNPADSMQFIDAVLAGIAACLSFVYSLYAYAKLQTRIATATGGWLDLISGDYFGTSLPRLAGESDASFRARIRAALVQAKATRAAIIQAVKAATGRTPIIFEPWRPADTGAYNNAQTLAYNTAGGYGSLALPAQYFITAYRPQSQSGVGAVAGYGVSIGAYNTASPINWIAGTEIAESLQDAAIYDVIANATAAGVIPWTRIEN